MMGAAKVLAALLASASVGAPIADAATVQVLFRSGDAAADGARLDSIDNPIATGPSTVIFRGGTSAILLRDGGGFGVVARTGDPLPPPLVGTFNDLGDPVINGAGAVAFQAGVNSPTQRGGTFLYERGTFVPIGILTTEGVLFAPGLVTDLNDAGDVLFSSKRRRIDLWSRADGQIAHVVKNGDSAPGVRRFRRFGRQLVLSDGGVVVFQANFQPLRTRPRMPHVLTGIFAGTGPGRLSVIARQGDPSPVPGAAYGPLFDEALSINAAGEVAFTGQTLRDPHPTPSFSIVRPDRRRALSRGWAIRWTASRCARSRPATSASTPRAG